MNKSNVEQLASWAGKVDARGYVMREEKELEFAVVGGFAFVDDEDGGVRRETFLPTAWDFRFVPVSDPIGVTETLAHLSR